MEQQKFLELLNEDLESEYRSIVQYIQDVNSIKGAEYQNAVEEMRSHLSQELEEEQLERYRKRVSQANDPGLPDTAEALAPLLRQTQDHVHELRSALDG